MKTAVSALLLVAIHLAGRQVDAQEAALSSQVKSAFLLNFARFVDWPESSFAARNTPFTLCASDRALQGILETTIRGETVDGRPIQLRRVNEPGTAKGCHLLYLTDVTSEARLQAAMGPILTVGETAEFIKNGGMIRFVEIAQRIRFEINRPAAERAGLKISSRLLRLAETVEGNP